MKRTSKHVRSRWSSRFLRHRSRLIKANACRVQPVLNKNENIDQVNKNFDQVQEDKNETSISESDSDSEMYNNNISKTPSSKSN